MHYYMLGSEETHQTEISNNIDLSENGISFDLPDVF